MLKKIPRRYLFGRFATQPILVRNPDFGRFTRDRRLRKRPRVLLPVRVCLGNRLSSPDASANVLRASPP